MGKVFVYLGNSLSCPSAMESYHHTSKEFELKDISSEDIEDVLLKVEKSFGFKFRNDELTDVKTFGESNSKRAY